MKKWSITLMTAVLETIVLWLVSYIFDWNFLDIILLGGLAIFGGVWLFRLNSNQISNGYNAVAKGWTGQNTGGISPFQFNMSPVTSGLLLFIFISLVITVFVYYPYFIN
jgi:hypothetical protein